MRFIMLLILAVLTVWILGIVAAENTPGEMIRVPAGTFEMGNPNDDGEYAEFPVHEVTLTTAYEIGKYEVTNLEYADILNWAVKNGQLPGTAGKISAFDQPLIDVPSSEVRIRYSEGQFIVRAVDGRSMSNHPVRGVSWYGAAIYCNWLSQSEGLEPCYDTSTWTCDFRKTGYHLPTEAQWERAAAWDTSGGGRHVKFANGSETIDCTNANFENKQVPCNPLGLSAAPFTTPVGYFNGENGTKDSPSPVGCYDMSGNVREWTNDRGRRVYTTEPVTNPNGPIGGNVDHSGRNGVLRGGGWYRYDGGNRSCDRGYSGPASLGHGFRLARTLYDEKQLRASGKASLYLGNGVNLELVPISPGTFDMGSTHHEEGPVHRVEITHPYYIGVNEVTQEQYMAVMGSNPSRFRGGKLPAENVSWEDAVTFCRRLSAMTGQDCRLPTEAEWEYAARAGTQTAYCHGDNLDASMANFNGNFPYGDGTKGIYRKTTVVVGSFEPNTWGLSDMHGNVWEWCADWYSGTYDTASVRDPQGPESGTHRVLRGGCWCYSARFSRSASRRRLAATTRVNNLGFRVAMD